MRSPAGSAPKFPLGAYSALSGERCVLLLAQDQGSVADGQAEGKRPHVQRRRSVLLKFMSCSRLPARITKAADRD